MRRRSPRRCAPAASGRAGLDVFDGEPAVRPELLAAPNATLLPHIGSATERSREAMLTAAAGKAAAALAS